MICLISSCSSLADKAPKVTLVGISTVNNIASPEKITKYNDKTCKLETKKQESFPLLLPDGTLNPILDGGVWMSYKDFISLYRFCSEECKKELNEQIETLKNETR